MSSGFSNLTWEKRVVIEHMLKEGCSIQEIADFLGVNHTTIRREIHRFLEGEYCAKDAQAEADKNKQEKNDNNKRKWIEKRKKWQEEAANERNSAVYSFLEEAKVFMERLDNLDNKEYIPLDAPFFRSCEDFYRSAKKSNTEAKRHDKKIKELEQGM